MNASELFDALLAASLLLVLIGAISWWMVVCAITQQVDPNYTPTCQMHSHTTGFCPDSEPYRSTN